MSEGSTPRRLPDTPTRRLSEQTPIAPSAPPFDDGSTNSLLTLDDEVTGVPEDVSRGCVLAIFDAVAFVTACAAGALGAAHVIQLMAFVAAPAPRGGLAGAIFAASISYQFALCLCIVGFELGVISHDDQWTGRYWTVRGLLYAFLGVIALPGAAADAATCSFGVLLFSSRCSRWHRVPRPRRVDGATCHAIDAMPHAARSRTASRASSLASTTSSTTT